MDGRSQTTLKVAYGAGADSGPLCQLFLRQARRGPQTLESCT
jgi:hypothetical protein